MHSKAYSVYSKRPKVIDEGIHIIFDESNDGRLSSSSIWELKLNKYDDNDEENEARAKSHIKHKEPPQESNHEDNVSPTNEELHSTNEGEPSIAPR